MRTGTSEVPTRGAAEEQKLQLPSQSRPEERAITNVDEIKNES